VRLENDHSLRKHIAPVFVVTGGAGAIGSRLVRRLLSESPESILVVDDLSSGYEWLLPKDERVKLIKQDVTNLLSSGVQAAEPVVFALAAFFANQNSVEHPVRDLHTNGLGTLTTLLWARENHARRLVYASAGCSIAGHDLSEPIRENMPVSLNLDTPYQITKALGEFYCNYFNSQVETVRCRFFNSYGPGELPGPYRNVIPNFIWRAFYDEPLIITGTGEETRDFIYVDDLVEGLFCSSQVENAKGGAFNLGTGTQTRIVDLAGMIIGLCKSRSRIEFAPRRAWDNSHHRQADISKSRALLGFQSAIQVEEGISRTVAWFRENHEKIKAEVSQVNAVGVQS